MSARIAACCLFRRFNHAARVICLFTIAVFLAVPAAQAEIDWQPSHTRLFAVGLLQWQDSSIYPSFPKAMPQRRDRQIVEHFKDRGVAVDRYVYLEDQQAVKSRIEHEFVALLKRSQPGELLVFYFAGHGSRDHRAGETYFVNYDAGMSYANHWSVRSIFDALEQHFRGSRVLLMADCCYSGALYDEARRRKPKFGIACLTSAYSHNTSTGRWTFTDAVLRGLRGEALVDLDGDGQVELHELARYTELDMAFVEQQKSMFYAAEGFDAETRLAETRGTFVPGLGRRTEVNWRGHWYPAQVIGIEGQQMRIHYVGFDSRWDELVTPDRVRSYSPHTYPRGARVEVFWSKDQHYYPATVEASWFGLHQVHYDGYAREWDEWVGSKLLRPLP